MSKKNTEIDKNCAYCERATQLYNPDYVLCKKRGVVSASHVCRKFAYDPLKRKPAALDAPALEFVNIDL